MEASKSGLHQRVLSGGGTVPVPEPKLRNLEYSTEKLVRKSDKGEAVLFWFTFLVSFLLTINFGIAYLSIPEVYTGTTHIHTSSELRRYKYDADYPEDNKYVELLNKTSEDRVEYNNLAFNEVDIVQNDFDEISQHVDSDIVSELPEFVKDEKVINGPKERKVCVETLESGNLSNLTERKAYTFWKRARQETPGSITLATQLSLDRLPSLTELALMWQGPVSAAVYICDTSDEKRLTEWYENCPIEIKDNVDIHVAIGNDRYYPINYLRNLAYNNTRLRTTNFIFLLDCDARVSGTMDDFQVDVKHVMEHLGTDGKGLVMIVPSFEWNVKPPPQKLPEKLQLREMFYNGSVQPMHKGRRSYSGPFKHHKWFKFDLDEVYEVRYEAMFEPYYIIKRDQSPNKNILFPEEFTGRGFNKQAHHFELWAAGFEYVTLSKMYIMDSVPVYDMKTDEKLSSFNENKPKWYEFRARIAKSYDIECRNIYWKQCDEREKNCDKVCQREKDKKHDYNGYPKHNKKSHRRDHDKKKKSSYEIRVEKFWNDFVEIVEKRSDTGFKTDLTGPLKTLRDIQFNPDNKEKCPNGKVDVVYTWVNGSDPWHMKVRNKYIPSFAFEETVDVGRGKKGRFPAGDLMFRFRDFGHASTLKYSIRSLLKYAPWVGTIWIVSGGIHGNPNDPQVPSWLDTNKTNGKVKFISHENVFSDPKAKLPTFNSCAIETQIHKIPGLSECYLYLNDDFILNEVLQFDDLWGPNEELPYAIFSGERAMRIGKDPWQKKVANVGRMIRHEIGVPWDQIFLVGHHGHFFLKTIAKELETRMQSGYNRTSLERWRTAESLWVPFVYSNYYAWNYKTKPKRVTSFYHRLTNEGGAEAIRSAFRELQEEKNHGKWQWLCFNDLLSSFTQEIEHELLQGFEKMFPNKAIFER